LPDLKKGGGLKGKRFVFRFGRQRRSWREQRCNRAKSNQLASEKIAMRKHSVRFEQTKTRFAWRGTSFDDPALDPGRLPRLPKPLFRR
jgi:hypothetical protein